VLHCQYAGRQDEDDELFARREDDEEPQSARGPSHGGNVSALLKDIAGREAKLAAAEAYFDKYGIPPLSDDDIESIEAEWHGALPKKKAKKRRAA
jgi:hypothetical protein